MLWFERALQEHGGGGDFFLSTESEFVEILPFVLFVETHHSLRPLILGPNTPSLHVPRTRHFWPD